LIVDLVIKNAKVFYQGEFLEGGVAANGGKIVAIAKEPHLPRADRVIDVKGNLVIPGLVDIHVHMREPGRTHKEDYSSGSRAAAAGGVTTFIDEPNTTPPTTTMEELERKQRLAGRKSIVDFSFSMGLNPGNLEEVPRFTESGIASFAVFDEMEGPQLDIPDAGTLITALKAIKRAGGVASLNCRHAPLRTWLTRRIKRHRGKDICAYSEASPPLEEAIGAAEVLHLARAVGVRTHVREISTLASLTVLDRWKTGNVTAEVTPNHLLLTTEDAMRLGPYAQIPPPIRSKNDSDALWAALNMGTVDVIASDHAPHTRAEKDRGLTDIWESPPGLPGVETMLSLLLTQVNQERINLRRLIELTSENPAKAFSLHPRKGVIQMGSDADFAIVDLHKKWWIKGDDLRSKVRWTSFEDWEVQGRVMMTVVRGVIVYDGEGDSFVKPGYGDYIQASQKEH
jgi:dihydroorotase (multifunctional complex type)